jgi:opacity protein-like surface antigen
MHDRILLAAALALAAHAASAADNGIYLGASVGQANVQLDDSLSSDFDANDTGYKIILGIRPLDWLGVEASYVDFGSPDDQVATVDGGTTVEANLDGISAFAVGFLAIGPVDLFAKVGLINWDGTVKAPELSLSASNDGTDFAYGVGAQFRVWSLSLRAEYEKFDIVDTDVNLLSVGVTWTFL